MPSDKTKHIPTRMCVGCRKKGDKNSFVRIIIKDDSMVIDKAQKANVRGFYICKDINCVKRIMKNKNYSKFFKNINAEEFFVQMEQAGE